MSDTCIPRLWYVKNILRSLVALGLLFFGFAAFAEASPWVIPVPYDPLNPSVPHPTYNKHLTTFKAIARGAPQVYYRWRTAGSSAWDTCQGKTPAIPNGNWYLSTSNNLECRNYLPTVDPNITPSKLFITTVEVTASVNPVTGQPTAGSVFASYPVLVHAEVPEAANAGAASPQQLAVMRAVAIDDALWYLHKQLKADGTSDHSQITGYIEASAYETPKNVQATALLALAMQENGHMGAYPPNTYQSYGSPIPDGFLSDNDVRYMNDPYAEDVIRALNYLLSNIHTYQIPATDEDDDGITPIPGTNDGTGFAIFETLLDDSAPDANSLPLAALAESRLQYTVSQVGNNNVLGKSMQFIVQQYIDWAAAAQIHNGDPLIIGGWSWNPGYQNPTKVLSYQTAGWIYALATAESVMGPFGVHVNQSVKDRLANMLVKNQYIDGGAQYDNSGMFPDSLFEPVGMMVLGCRWLGWDLWQPQDQSSAGYTSINLTKGAARNVYSNYVNYIISRWQASGGLEGASYSHDRVLWSDGNFNGVMPGDYPIDAASNLWTYSLFAVRSAATGFPPWTSYFGSHDWWKEFGVSLVKGQRFYNREGSYVDASGASIAGLSGVNVATGYALLAMSGYEWLDQALDDTYEVDMNCVLTVPAPGILANDAYSQNGPGATLMDYPNHGTVSLSYAGSFTYQPNANYYGQDTFAYRVGSSNGATVFLNIKPVMGTATLVMEIQPIQFYDATPKTVTVITVPNGLTGVIVTYNGLTTPPTAIGTYTVEATLNNPDYVASPVTGSFQIVDPTNPVYWTHDPVANPGGPYIHSEGNDLVLDAGGSTDPDMPWDHIVSYHWDLNGDGIFTDLVVASPVVTIPWAQIDDLIHPVIGRTYPLALKVMDATSRLSTASETTLQIIQRTNNAPQLATIGDRNVNEGQLIQFTVNAVDPDGDIITYSASNLPTGATFDPATRTFTWTPDYSQAGNYPNVLFGITDNGTPPLGASEAITITVGNVNRPPVLNTIGDRLVKEGATLQFTVSASDPDGDTLIYSASGLPQGATFDAASRTFTWTPEYNQAGNYFVRFAVIDDGTPHENATEEITISVGNVNRPPALNSIGNQTVAEGQALTIVVTAVDPDGDALTYSANNLPSGATFDSVSQTFTWTPDYGQAGTYANIEFTAMDNGSPAELDLEVITITVGNVDREPVFTPVGPQSVQETQLLEFYVTAADPDGDAITYSAGALPRGASFDAATGVFSWIPDNTQAGTYTATFYATDGLLSGRTDVAITVGEAPTPCELADRLISAVVELNLPKEVENSYMANLKKVCKFIQDGKVTAAINQIKAFMNKVTTDIVQGNISNAAGGNLMTRATDIITMLGQ